MPRSPMVSMRWCCGTDSSRTLSPIDLLSLLHANPRLAAVAGGNAALKTKHQTVQRIQLLWERSTAADLGSSQLIPRLAQRGDCLTREQHERLVSAAVEAMLFNQPVEFGPGLAAALTPDLRDALGFIAYEDIFWVMT
jgi:hypothetical protein